MQMGKKGLKNLMKEAQRVQQRLESEMVSVTMVYPPPRWLIHQGISPT